MTKTLPSHPPPPGSEPTLQDSYSILQWTMQNNNLMYFPSFSSHCLTSKALEKAVASTDLEEWVFSFYLQIIFWMKEDIIYIMMMAAKQTYMSYIHSTECPTKHQNVYFHHRIVDIFSGHPVEDMLQSE